MSCPVVFMTVCVTAIIGLDIYSFFTDPKVPKELLNSHKSKKAAQNEKTATEADESRQREQLWKCHACGGSLKNPLMVTWDSVPMEGNFSASAGSRAICVERDAESDANLHEKVVVEQFKLLQPLFSTDLKQALISELVGSLVEG